MTTKILTKTAKDENEELVKVVPDGEFPQMTKSRITTADTSNMPSNCFVLSMNFVPQPSVPVSMRPGVFSAVDATELQKARLDSDDPNLGRPSRPARGIPVDH